MLHLRRLHNVDFVFVAHPYITQQVQRSCDAARERAGGLALGEEDELVWSTYAADQLLGSYGVADAPGVFSILAQAAVAAPAIMWGPGWARLGDDAREHVAGHVDYGNYVAGSSTTGRAVADGCAGGSGHVPGRHLANVGAQGTGIENWDRIGYANGCRHGDEAGRNMAVKG